jgi:putative transposase
MISDAVWLYEKFNLSHRDIADVFVEHGSTVRRASIRLWCVKFGALRTGRFEAQGSGLWS